MIDLPVTDTKGERTKTVRQCTLSEVVHNFSNSTNRGGNNPHRNRGNWKGGVSACWMLMERRADQAVAHEPLSLRSGRSTWTT